MAEETERIKEYLAKHDVASRLNDALNAAIQAQSTDPIAYIGALLSPKTPPRPAKAVGTFLRLVTVNDVYTLANYPHLRSAVAAEQPMYSLCRMQC